MTGARRNCALSAGVILGLCFLQGCANSGEKSKITPPAVTPPAEAQGNTRYMQGVPPAARAKLQRNLPPSR
jgi:hypothetical protein